MNDPEKPVRRFGQRTAWLVGFGGLAILAGLIFTGSFRRLFNLVVGEPERAHAMLRVEPARAPVFDKNGSVQAGSKGDYSEYYLKTQMSLLKSKNVLEGAMTNPMVSELPIVRRQNEWYAWLSNALRVEAIPGTFLIRVSMEDGNPDEAYEILNAVIRSYMDGQKRYGQISNSMLIRSLQDESSKLKAEIKASSDRLGEMARNSGLDEADPSRRSEHRQHIRRELLSTKLRIAAEQVRGLRTDPKKGQEVPKGEVISTEPLKILEAQLKVLEAELTRVTDGEREAITLAQKIEKLETLNSTIQNHIRQANYEAETEFHRVTIADPVRRIKPKP